MTESITPQVLVGVIMSSVSDWDTLQHAVKKET